jgi:hypothetical protein
MSLVEIMGKRLGEAGLSDKRGVRFAARPGRFIALQAQLRYQPTHVRGRLGPHR